MKDFKLVEHNLIPLSLFILNVSIVHLIYDMFMNTWSPTALLVLTCTAMMILGILKKNKYLMIPAILIYVLALLLSF